MTEDAELLRRYAAENSKAAFGELTRRHVDLVYSAASRVVHGDVIKAEPADLTRGVMGGPDKAFLGSQADIDHFLEQVAQSKQRILQQAADRLNAEQLAALDNVLAKAIEARKLQGTAFFQKR